MNTQERTDQRAIVLWLSGMRLEDIRGMPEVEMLIEQGALVNLDPSPITGMQAQQFQAFSGRLPARFGFFDTVVPRGYAVVEESLELGADQKSLPDLLRTVGWTVDYREMPPSDLAACLEALPEATQPTCLIVKCAVDSSFPRPALAHALRLAHAWLGESSLLALLSDTHLAPVERFVNINNFLTEVGILERDEGTGRINWANSLAYHAGHGQLWVNLRGRDAQGAVHPQDEYDDVRDTLVNALPQKLHDGGRTVIERVYRKEELYASEYLFRMPDLVIVLKPGYAPSPQSVRLDFDLATFTVPVPGTYTTAGVHPSSVQGFLLAQAPALIKGATVVEAQPLVAAVPTLLHALGVEYTGMDTGPVVDLFSPTYLERFPVRLLTGEQELSEEDEERIISHLRDLGYV